MIWRLFISALAIAVPLRTLCTYVLHLPGVISSPKVAFNGYGYPATITAPEGGLLTLHSMYLTSAWDEDNIVTITAKDDRDNVVGTYVTSLSTDDPRQIDFETLPADVVTGTFVGVKAIVVTTTRTQVALDNVHVTVVAEPGREIVPVQMEDLEFWEAPPGASAPIRKPHPATPLKDGNAIIVSSRRGRQ